MTADSNMVDAENYIMMAADRNGIKTDVELNNYIDGLAHLFSLSPFNLTPSQYEIVRKHVATKFRVKIVPGFTLSYEHEPWFYDAYNLSDKGFWKRYRTNLSKERSPTAIGEMDAFTNKVMDCCGNPSFDKPFERYGLVIGDVQSGKTSTYVGLMCKAADVKYDIFIVLTGMSNNLRRQTQVRIEEGFVGFKSDSGEKVGVGNINPSINAFSYTSLLDDFKGQISINASATKVSGILPRFSFKD